MEHKGRKGGITAAILALLSAFWVSIIHQGPGWHEISSTMAIRYQAVERTAESWGQPRDMNDTLTVLRERLRNHMGGSFSIREWNSNQWSIKRNLDETILRVKDILNDTKIGDKYLVKAWSDGFQQKTRTVDINPAAYADTDGTHAIDIIVGTLNKWYPNTDIGGIYVCRTIAGSSNLSQHSYANAVDVFGTSAEMNNAAWGIYRMAKAGWIPVSQILWDNKNLFTGNYVYDHTNHIHFSGDPLMSGACRRAG
jgi:hypothetical protein